MLARCFRVGAVKLFDFAFEDLKEHPPELENLTKNIFGFKHHKIHTPTLTELEILMENSADTPLFTGSLPSRSSISGSGSRTHAVACDRRTF